MDNYYVSKLLPLMAEAQLHVVANPLINITLQGRHDTYPKRRGMTRVKELLEAVINVAFGHDALMDPWYSFGTHDMLEVAHMGLHVAQMTGVEQMRQIFETVTTNGARVMGLEGYGIEPPERGPEHPGPHGRLGEQLTEEQREAIHEKVMEMRKAGASHNEIQDAVREMLEGWGIEPPAMCDSGADAATLSSEYETPTTWGYIKGGFS